MSEDFKEKLNARNVDALYEIKKLLGTRCSDTQMSAASVLESCLLNEPVTNESCPFREFLLDEDLVGFLCDAMATNSWPLLMRLAYVLDLLSDNDKMFLEGHAVVAAETAQRRAHFLGLMVAGAGTSTECETALQAILGLLATLLTRWSVVLGPEAGVSSLCPPQGVLSTLRLVLGSRATSSSTRLAAAQTLCWLLRLVAVGREPGDATNLAAAIAACVRAAVHSLLVLVAKTDGEEVADDERKRTTDEACECICAIAARVTSIRASCEGLADVDDALVILEGLEAETLEAVLEKCLPMVVQAARTCIEAAHEDDAESGFSVSESEGQGHSQPNMTWVLLDSLECVLERGKDPVALSDTLACQGFLWLLPALHRTERNSSTLRLLCSILAHLAHDLLDAESWWSGGGGATGLAAFLGTATPHLADDNHDWPLVLELEMESYLPLESLASPAAAAHLLVLLLTYFRAVAGSDTDQDECQALVRSLPRHVMSLPSCPPPPPSIVKMTWMCFAVHCVLRTDTLAAAVRAASARLTLLLDQLLSRGALHLAFTAHPALLYWAFQAAGVPPRLQRRVLELWLGQQDDLDAEDDADTVASTRAAPVLEIVLAQAQAVHPLLDVVAAGEPPTAGAAARILCKAAASKQKVADDLVAGVWGRLPLSLSRCGGLRTSDQDAVVEPTADGCGLLVGLAAEVYRPPPADMALRVANLIGGVLGRGRLGTTPRHLTAAMLILTKLLEDGRSRNDPRVHATLLSDGRFARAMLSATNNEDVQVGAAALHLLRLLEEDNAVLKSPVVFAATPLDLGSVLTAVYNNNIEVFEAGLLLLVEVLKPKARPFLILQDDDEILRSVYFVLQNQALRFQGVAAVNDAVWRALKELLSRHELLPPQAWNYVVIKHVLKQMPLAKLSREFFLFVLEWLKLMAPEEPPQPTPRRPMPTMLTETSIEIASALVNAGDEFRRLPVGREMAKALLAVTADFPPDLMTRLTEYSSGANHC